MLFFKSFQTFVKQGVLPFFSGYSFGSSANFVVQVGLAVYNKDLDPAQGLEQEQTLQSSTSLEKKNDPEETLPALPLSHP